MGKISFWRATTKDERQAIDLFLARHNGRGRGSTGGYVAYYAATSPDDGRPLVDRIVAAAKFCPLHTPSAARFYGGEHWRHVYCLQRLAAHRAPRNLLSRFLAWCLREEGKDPKVWFVATMADTNSFDGHRPHVGYIYQATNAVYFGLSRGGRVEAIVLDGVRRSVRSGPKTLRLADIPPRARIIRSRPQHRYCWAVGSRWQRVHRRRILEKRVRLHFGRLLSYPKSYQPRLLARVRELSSGDARLQEIGIATSFS